MLQKLVVVFVVGVLASGAFGQIQHSIEPGPSAGDAYSLNIIGTEPDGDDWSMSDMDIDMVPGTGASLIDPEDNPTGPWAPPFPIGDEVDTFVVSHGNPPTLAPLFLTGTYDATGHSEVTWADDGSTADQALLLARIAFDLTGSGLAGPLLVTDDGAPNPGGVKIADLRVRSGSDFQFDPVQNPRLWDIYAVPEPASLALLALGGLAAFRRR